MEQTTEQRQSEFSPLFIRWLVSLTAMTLVFAFVLNLKPFLNSIMTPYPWTTAGGLVIQQGLNMFSGNPPGEIPGNAKSAILLSLLAAFVIGPTMLFFSWRRLVVDPMKLKLKPANIAFLFGGGITSLYFVSVVTAACIHPQVASSMREAQALGENRDMVIRGMSFVSYDAIQYRILPKTSGGGGGTYVGYHVPDGLRKTNDGEFLQSDVTDSTLTISGGSLMFEGAVVRGIYGPDGKLRGHFDFIGQFR